jgi:hypothetical protein
MGTNGGEFFGRIDTPENVMVKGFVGLGRGDQGHINDEDWGVALGDPINEIVPYQNTESPTTTKIRYFTLDLGYDLFRAPSYKIAPFIGYNYFSYNMSAFGCTRVNFVPPQTCDSDAPPRALFLQEMDTWISWRLGTSAVLVVAPGLRLVGDFAYLPVVRYSGIDNHPQRAGEEAITLSPAHGDGTGVQVEGVIALRCDSRVQPRSGRPLLGHADPDPDHQLLLHERVLQRAVCHRADRRVRAGLLQIRRAVRVGERPHPACNGSRRFAR